MRAGIFTRGPRILIVDSSRTLSLSSRPWSRQTSLLTTPELTINQKKALRAIAAVTPTLPSFLRSNNLRRSDSVKAATTTF
jgi:hypothetical protein